MCFSRSQKTSQVFVGPCRTVWASQNSSMYCLTSLTADVLVTVWGVEIKNYHLHAVSLSSLLTMTVFAVSVLVLGTWEEFELAWLRPWTRDVREATNMLYVIITFVVCVSLFFLFLAYCSLISYDILGEGFKRSHVSIVCLHYVLLCVFHWFRKSCEVIW